MRHVLLVTLLMSFGCRGEIDEDQDGTPDWADCDDLDAAVGPTQAEVCNGIDDDCDGTVDVGATDAATFYADVDGDGAGTVARSEAYCEAPAGFVSTADDCDDSDASVYPGAAEDDCSDPIDYNCDGSVGYADADGDGFAACEDCNDGKASINPNAVEFCDGTDNNCDGETDEAGAFGETTWYSDADGDGFGDPTAASKACDQPTGYVVDDSDCDDLLAGVNPGASETCNDTDDNCNGTIDDSPTDASIWYIDVDADGHGGNATVEACTQPSGYLATSDDCNDANPQTYAGADELCDGQDNDCDGTIDNSPVDESTWYADSDSDRYGDDNDTTLGCDAPPGYIDLGGDCDDKDSGVRPGSAELCNGKDDNCDGSRDEGHPLSTAYADADADGEGDANTSLEVCAPPTGYTWNSSDCDDGNSDLFTGNTESCDDGADNDCDEAVDCDDLEDCKEIDEQCWVCSDLVVDPNETCDDGNTEYGDGCDANCQSEWDGPITFTNCNQEGRTGPTQADCDSEYSETTLDGSVALSAGYQSWTVPTSGTYLISAAGAQGGFGAASQAQRGLGWAGGLGAKMEGEFDLTEGDVIVVVVGQQGIGGLGNCNCGGGGGGGSFVWLEEESDLLVAAGGGGGGNGSCWSTSPSIHGTTNTSGQTPSSDGGYTAGAGGSNGQGGGSANNGASCGYCGAGGAGWLADGQAGGQYGDNYGRTRVNGFLGGRANNNGTNGGFGGGAATGDDGRSDYSHGNAGGGGYSGGGGMGYPVHGGGGGSFNGGANQTNTTGVNAGHGYVTIDRL